MVPVTGDRPPAPSSVPGDAHGDLAWAACLAAVAAVLAALAGFLPADNHWDGLALPVLPVEVPWRALALGLAAAAMLAVAALALAARGGLRAEERLRADLACVHAEVARSEYELSVVVRSAQELLFRTDARGILTFVNAGWKGAGSGLPDTIIGSRLDKLVEPGEQAAVRAMLSAAVQGGVHGDIESPRCATVTLRTGQGRPRRFDVAVVPLLRGGRIEGFAGSAIDITEREEAQARLAEQLRFSALLQEVSPLPTSVLGTRGRYLNVNRAWQEFTGLGLEEALGRPADGMPPHAEAREHEAHDQRLLREGGGARYEAVATRADGSRRDLLVSKVAEPGRDGRPQGVLCTFMDVTELRNAARATQEAREAAEESSRAKVEFIANLSHELRTPLQSIIGFSELGMARAPGDGRAGAMFGDIHASGQRMLALVNDLLEVSKIESAVGTIHLERTDLRPLLREVMRELAPQLAAKRLALRETLPAAPLRAKVDPGRFQQVVRNVLANAIKFAPAGTAIGLQAREGEDGGAWLSVLDQGPGIPPDELESIFEAFVQSSQTKDGSGGTGLGLAICRKIIDAHGGTITAGNLAQGGSRFDIRLPARGAAETRPAELNQRLPDATTDGDANSRPSTTRA